MALMLVAVMHFITDDHGPYDLVQQLRGVLPSGSYLVMTHATGDHLTAEERAKADAANLRSGVPFRFRSAEEFTRFFMGLELLPPGITSVVDWHPDVPPQQRPTVKDVSMLCGVARVP
jgi:S-adenosyl methyltransferase